MATVPIEANMSSDQLLRAVEHLPPQELASFVRRVLILKAQREAPSLSQAESALLGQINLTLSPPQQQQYDALIARRDAGTIRAEELATLIQMTDDIERQDAQRMAALIQLAQLRQTSVPEVMVALGIKAPRYA